MPVGHHVGDAIAVPDGRILCGPAMAATMPGLFKRQYESALPAFAGGGMNAASALRRSGDGNRPVGSMTCAHRRRNGMD